MIGTLLSRALAVALGVGFATAAASQPLGNQEPNGVRWLSGGVSLEERDAMRNVAPDYNLRVVVAMAHTG